MINIDILYLVDRLEAAINKGFVVPFSSKRMIDEDEALDIIDQMRIAVPEEIRQARRVTHDKDRVLAQAKEEADRVVQLAKEDAARNGRASVKFCFRRARQVKLLTCRAFLFIMNANCN